MHTISVADFVKNKAKNVLIISGEASGDLHGASLVKALKQYRPQWMFWGIGGDRIAEAGVELIYHIQNLGFIGFFEWIRHFPFIRKVFYEIIRQVKIQRPDLVILIDYPGFNLRMAKALHREGIPVIYYIGPQIWAWGKNRIKTMKKWIDRILVIFDFEKDIYRKEDMDVVFVGHPLKDVVQVSMSKEAFFNALKLDQKKPLLALFPGSRSQEIRYLLPRMLKAVDLLRNDFPSLQCAIGMASSLSEEIYFRYLKHAKEMHMMRGFNYELMAYSNAVLVASGTATLETAILGTPMVILYRMSPLSFWIGKRLVQTSHIGLVNIVAQKTVVPELLQEKVTPENIRDAVLPFLKSSQYRESVCTALREVAKRLGPPGASERAAKSILEFIEK